MTFAHKGVELKPIPFVEPEAPAEEKAPEVASDTTAAPDGLSDLGESQPRPSNLSAETTERLLAIADLMQKAPQSQAGGRVQADGAARTPRRRGRRGWRRPGGQPLRPVPA